MAFPAGGGSERLAIFFVRRSWVACVGRQGCRRLHPGQEVLPHQVQHRLHVAHAAGDGDDGVLLGHHDAVLAEGPVAAVDAVAAAPELVAVALVPVARRVAAVRDLARGGRRHPLGGQEALAAPLALLQVELAEAGDVLGRHRQAEPAEGNALRGRVPRRVADAQRLEEARPQVVEERRAAHLLDDRGEHVASPACCRRSACRACGPRAGRGRPASGTRPGPCTGTARSRPRGARSTCASRSRTRIAFRFSLGSAGASSGKNESTVSSRLSFPSAIARPTAVEVKLLLSEKSTCGSSRRRVPTSPRPPRARGAAP